MLYSLQNMEDLLLFHEKYQLILNLMAATCHKKLGQGQQKAGNVSGTRKKQLEEEVDN